jgi:hypothetical protein
MQHRSRKLIVKSHLRLKHVLVVEAGTPSSGNNGGMRYGPVLAQNQEFVYVNRGNVLDPEHVKVRGAPKKGFRQWIRKYQRNNVVVAFSGSQSAYLLQEKRGSNLVSL